MCRRWVWVAATLLVLVLPSTVAALGDPPRRLLSSSSSSTGSGSLTPLSSTGPSRAPSPIPSEVLIGVVAQFSFPSDDADAPNPPYDPASPVDTSQLFGFGDGPAEFAALKWALQRINNRSDILPQTQIRWTICDGPSSTTAPRSLTCIHPDLTLSHAFSLSYLPLCVVVQINIATSAASSAL